MSKNVKCRDLNFSFLHSFRILGKSETFLIGNPQEYQIGRAHLCGRTEDRERKEAAARWPQRRFPSKQRCLIPKFLQPRRRLVFTIYLLLQGLLISQLLNLCSFNFSFSVVTSTPDINMLWSLLFYNNSFFSCAVLYSYCPVSLLPS